METALDLVEKVWLSEGRAKFINDAEEITLADLQLSCELEQLIVAG